jgi:hypothetical protein
MPKEVLFNASLPDVVEQGAALVTLLTHPQKMLSDAENGGARNEEFAWRVHETLCVGAYYTKARSDPSWGYTRQLIRPSLIGLGINERLLMSVAERWRRALVAGKMGWIFIDHVLTGELPEALRDVKRLTLDNVSGMLSAETRLQTPHNFENRIFREFRPVIHVLAAVYHLMEKSEPNGRSPVTMGHLVAHPASIEAVIHKAEEFEEILLQSRPARIASESLLRVRLAA